MVSLYSPSGKPSSEQIKIEWRASAEATQGRQHQQQQQKLRLPATSGSNASAPGRKSSKSSSYANARPVPGHQLESQPEDEQAPEEEDVEAEKKQKRLPLADPLFVTLNEPEDLGTSRRPSRDGLQYTPRQRRVEVRFWHVFFGATGAAVVIHRLSV